MAAIDKMYLRNYYTFDEFRLWCIANKPSLLYHFYNWNMTEEEWDKWKEDCYQEQKEILENQHSRYESIETFREFVVNTYKDFDVPDEQLQAEIDYHYKLWNAIQNKESWIENHSLPVANLSTSEDKYLLWHCPIKEIRNEYLFGWGGYEEKWYYKFFFKD